jgi:hypothetical protein
LSTDAVTTIELQCFWAAMPAAMSIQYIKRPPINPPKKLVSLGSTNSVMIVKLSPGDFSICLFFAKVKEVDRVTGNVFYLPNRRLAARKALKNFLNEFVFPISPYF